MSAIFGILGPASADDLERMAARLRHKGRFVSWWSPASDVWLGEVRDTPRQDDEAGEFAFAGQLYLDWREVPGAAEFSREERHAHERRIVRDALATRGSNFTDALDGYFGVAWWRPDSRELLLAADRINYENLYYTRTGERFVFASEYKALLALDDVEASPDPDALQYSIASFLPNYDGSLCKNIERVRYGYTLIVSADRDRTEHWFRPRCRPVTGGLAEHADGLRRILMSEIRGMLGHHDRIAITLGGGLDSAGLLGMLRHAFPGKTIASYTIGTGPDDREITGARETAGAFGTEHHEFEFRPEALAADLPKIIWLSEEFASREEALLQYQLESRIVGREDVLTGGHGADMIFGGMPRHRLVRMAETLPFVGPGLTELYQQTQSGRVPRSMTGRLLSYLAYRGRHVEPPRIAGSSGPSSVYEPTGISDMLDDLIGGFHPFHYHSPIYSLAPIETFMPYMSRAVMEHSLGIPSRYKVGLFRQKVVLRQALVPFLPAHIRNRPKAIQRARRDTTMSDVLEAMATTVLGESSVFARGLVDPAYVRQVRRRPASGIYSGDQLSRLWMLICSELWCRTFIDGRGSPIHAGSNRNLFGTVPARIGREAAVVYDLTARSDSSRVPTGDHAAREPQRLQGVKTPSR